MLRAPADLTIETLSHLAIGVKKPGPYIHVALIYTTSDISGCQLSHLGWHHQFRDEAWDGEYHWDTVNGLLEHERKSVASWLKAFAQNPQQIGYGFSADGCQIKFNTNGDPYYVPGEPGKGLTCAGYVIFVLENLGYKFLLKETWPSRPDDVTWQREILELLRHRSEMTETELAAVESDIGVVRFRPLEVMGAARQTPWPVDFESASALALRIQAHVASLGAGGFS